MSLTIHRLITPNGSLDGVTPTHAQIAARPWPAPWIGGSVVYQPSVLMGGSVPELTAMIGAEAQLRLRAGMHAWVRAAGIDGTAPGSVVCIDRADAIDPRFPTPGYQRSEWARGTPAVYSYAQLFADMTRALVTASRLAADGRRMGDWGVPCVGESEVEGPALNAILAACYGPMIGPGDVLMPVAYFARPLDSQGAAAWRRWVAKILRCALYLVGGDPARLIPCTRARYCAGGQTGYITADEWQLFAGLLAELGIREAAVWEACATFGELDACVAWANGIAGVCGDQEPAPPTAEGA